MAEGPAEARDSAIGRPRFTDGAELGLALAQVLDRAADIDRHPEQLSPISPSDQGTFALGQTGKLEAAANRSGNLYRDSSKTKRELGGRFLLGKPSLEDGAAGLKRYLPEFVPGLTESEIENRPNMPLG